MLALRGIARMGRFIALLFIDRRYVSCMKEDEAESISLDGGEDSLHF